MPAGESTGAGGTRTRQPVAAELEAAAAGIRERLGFGGEEVEEPVPLEAIELPAAAAEAAGGARRPLHRRAATSGSRTRSARPTATWCAASAGEFENPPDLVAFPRDESEIEPVLRWCAERGGGGDPLRRRHQRRRRGRAAARGGVPRRGHDRPAALSTGCWRSTRSRWRRGSRPGRPARRSRTSCASTGSPCATSRSRSSTRPSAAGSRPGPAATSRPSTPTSTTWSSRCGRSPRAGAGRAGGCRARAPGPSPDRMLIGSEGILGVITEAWVRVRERPRFKPSCGVGVRRLLAAAPRRSARSPSPASTRPTAACSTRRRRSSRTRARRGKALLVLGFESAHHPVDAPMDIALEIARAHGGEPGEVRGRREAPESDRPGPGALRENPPPKADGDDPVGAWRHAFLAAPYLRDTFVACGVLSRHLRDGDHLGPLRGLPRAR